MIGWSDGELRDRMVVGWEGGIKEGTPCGNGSLLANTANARKHIPSLLLRHDIQVVCDAGAGDGHWHQGIFSEVEYLAFDLVPRSPDVEQLDISTTPLPPCDLIICRLTLIHLDPPRIVAALKLFRQSARFLLATTHEVGNIFNPSSQYNRINLQRQPYSIGTPIEAFQDSEEAICSLALWDFRC